MLVGIVVVRVGPQGCTVVIKGLAGEPCRLLKKSLKYLCHSILQHRTSTSVIPPHKKISMAICE